MDTKSKNTNLARGVFAWLCHILFFFALIAAVLYSLTLFSDYGSDIFNTMERAVSISQKVICGELRELNTYKESASNFFERLYYNTADDNEEHKIRNVDGSLHYGAQYLESISKDNLYAVTDRSGSADSVTVTNDPNWMPGTLPKDFNYLFICKDRTVEIFHGQADGTLQSVYRSDEPGAFYTNTLTYTLDAMRSDPDAPDICFAVRTEPTSYHAASEIVSAARTYANQLLFQILLIGVAAVLFVLLLLFGIVLRRDRRLFEERLASGLKRIWIEIKLLTVLLIGLLSFSMIFQSTQGWIAVCGLYFVFLLVHLFLVDISHNRRIWRHNVIHSVLKAIAGTKRGKRFEQIEYRKYLAVICVLFGLAVITFLVTFICWERYPFFELLPLFYIAVCVAAVGTLFWFAAALHDDLRDYSILMDQIEQMYNGDLTAVNHLPATSPLYASAMQLNMIRDGIKIAVEEGIQSERTKVELITNVSHDIKTPLTSIIGYIELLKTEEDLPPHVLDYIGIISQKSNRLRHMIQDIFDVSKATTGNIALEPEYLNLKMLLQQTLADMEELIETSPMQWRVQLPEDTYPVYVDGQRMYRVFQNLIKNAAQYALEGSRIYINLVKQDGRAVFSMQNISRNELPADGESLTQRFVRGDDSRSSSGSGLGLSIAKSFTEACGGTFAVHVQGDLFTVVITLPLQEPPEPPAQPLPETTEQDESTADTAAEN